MSTRRLFLLLAVLTAALGAVFALADLGLACTVAIGMALAFLLFAFTIPPEGRA